MGLAGSAKSRKVVVGMAVAAAGELEAAMVAVAAMDVGRG